MDKQLPFYQIYLDVPMMTNFLASIQGGYSESAEYELKEGENDKDTQGISGGISIPGIELKIGGNKSNEFAQQMESSYKTNVKYTQSILFNTLRNALIKEEKFKNITTESDIANIVAGDIVEFSATAKPDSSSELGLAFKKLMPMAAPIYQGQLMQQRAYLKILEEMKNKSDSIVVNEGDDSTPREEITPSNKSKYIQGQKLAIANTEAEIRQMELLTNVMESIFDTSKSISNVIFQNENFRIVGRVHSDYARHNTVAELYSGEWKILAKVIRKISPTSPYDLLKDSPLSYFNQNEKKQVFAGLQNEQLQLPKVEQEIKEESLLVVPIGIFQ